MEIMNDEPKNICRVCLHSPDKTKHLSLFEQYKDSSIAVKINLITDIDIREDDGLPAQICPDCLLELETALNFKLKCEDSNKILLSKEVSVQNQDKLVEIKKEKDIEFKYEVALLEETNQKELQHEDENQSLSCQREDHERQELLPPTKLEILNQNVRKSKPINLKVECHDCGGFFINKCKLRVHWKTAHKPRLICEVCRKVFSTYKSYHLHRKNRNKRCLNAAKVHVDGEGKSRIYHCKVCDYQVKTMYRMKNHLVIHSGERPYKCVKCDSRFTQLSSLQRHKEISHNEFIVEVKCKHCGKFLQGRNRLYNHMRIHQPKLVQCDLCKKFLRNKTNLIEHIRRHRGIHPLTCEICGTVFSSLEEIGTHKLTHSKEKTKTCDICGYKASTMATIRKHKSKHTDTNCPCQTCGVFFESAKMLAIHMRKHLDRPHACPHCNLTFHGKKACNSHISKKHKCTVVSNNQTEISNDIDK